MVHTHDEKRARMTRPVNRRVRPKPIRPLRPRWVDAVRSPLLEATALLVRGAKPPSTEALRLLRGPVPRSDMGAPMDPEMEWLLTVDRLLRVPHLNELPIPLARFMTDLHGRALGHSGRADVRVEDHWLPTSRGQVTARLYVPNRGPAPYPVVIYAHGGGFVVGSVTSHDGVCRELAAHGDVAVLSIEYRLAPECPFPTAVHDVYAAYHWVRHHGACLRLDPSRVAVAGDSAGANLAANVCVIAQHEGDRQPDHQLLIYPAVDTRRTRPSREIFNEGYYLSGAMIDWFTDHYTREPEDLMTVHASPILNESHEGLAPATVVTAGFDPLRDDGKAYADALRRAGVPTTYRCEESLVHGFVNTIGAVKSARASVQWMAEQLAQALHR